MAREASAGTRAGAVRAGILEAATEVSPAQAALAFRAETNREGLEEVARTTPARAWGKAGRTMLRELVTVAGRQSGAGCAHGMRMRETDVHPRVEQWTCPRSSVCSKLFARETVIHSFFPVYWE